MNAAVLVVAPAAIFAVCALLAWSIDCDEHYVVALIVTGVASLCFFYAVIYGSLSACSTFTPEKKLFWAVVGPVVVLVVTWPTSFSDRSMGMGFISIEIPVAYLLTIPGQILLLPFVNGRADQLRVQRQEREYAATPDLNNNDIFTIARCPYLDVSPKDLVAFPGGGFLLSFDVRGPKAGTKLAAFTSEGKFDSGFNAQTEAFDYLRHDLVADTEGDFLLVNDVFLKGWSDDAALLRDQHGKGINPFSPRLTEHRRLLCLRFARDGRLYGVEQNEPGTDLLGLDLVEMSRSGDKVHRKTRLLPVLEKSGGFTRRYFICQDLFFWPDGDVGLIAFADRDADKGETRPENYVIRIDPQGKRVKEVFIAGSGVSLNSFRGFLADGSLILGSKGDGGRDELRRFKDGKEVEIFSGIINGITNRLKIGATGVIGSGEIVIAGNRIHEEGMLEIISIDQNGRERNRVAFGK
jgi:hypothetical protein